MHIIYSNASIKVSKPTEKSALTIPDYFIPINNQIKKELIEEFYIDENRITVLSSGADVDFFSNVNCSTDFAHNKYDINNDNKIILYSGTFIKWKGVDTLIKSAQYIKNKHYKILLIGGTSPEKENMQLLIDNLHLNSRIIIDEFLAQKELISILKTSDIAVIPNNTEEIGQKYTSPLKLFEYLSCGLPLVCADLPSMHDIIVENDNALFFEPENPIDLANKIDFLLLNDNLQTSMRHKNATLAREFSWTKRAKRIFNIIKNNYNAQ